MRGIRQVETTTAEGVTTTFQVRVTIDGQSFVATKSSLAEAITWRDSVKADPTLAVSETAIRSDKTRIVGWVTAWAETAGNPNTTNSRKSCLAVFDTITRPRGSGGKGGDTSPLLTSLKRSHFEPWEGTGGYKRYAASTVDVAWAQLHAALEYAVDQGKLASNPEE